MSVEAHYDLPFDVAISPHNKTLVAMGRDGILKVWPITP